MKREFKFFLIIFIFVFIFFVLFQGLKDKNYYEPYDTLNTEISNFKSEEFFSNKEIMFDDVLKNKNLTVLNIWASWCAPCRIEHKYIIQLASESKINLIGLNYKDKISNAKDFINEFGNPYNLILIDKHGLNSIELGAYGVPETYIIKNSNKKIIKKYIGPLNQTKINEIKKILKNEIN